MLIKMNGELVKKDGNIVVKWSDLHSSLHGWYYMYTNIKNIGTYNVGDKVEFELEIIGYDEKNYNPNQIANIL